MKTAPKKTNAKIVVKPIKRDINLGVRLPDAPITRLKYICKVTNLSQSKAVEQMIESTFRAVRKIEREKSRAVAAS